MKQYAIKSNTQLMFLWSCRYAKYDPNGKEPSGPCDYAISHEKDGLLLGVPADAGNYLGAMLDLSYTKDNIMSLQYKYRNTSSSEKAFFCCPMSYYVTVPVLYKYMCNKCMLQVGSILSLGNLGSYSSTSTKGKF